jgi:hypothetical protein
MARSGGAFQMLAKQLRLAFQLGADGAPQIGDGLLGSLRHVHQPREPDVVAR